MRRSRRLQLALSISIQACDVSRTLHTWLAESAKREEEQLLLRKGFHGSRSHATSSQQGDQYQALVRQEKGLRLEVSVTLTLDLSSGWTFDEAYTLQGLVYSATVQQRGPWAEDNHEHCRHYASRMLMEVS